MPITQDRLITLLNLAEKLLGLLNTHRETINRLQTHWATVVIPEMNKTQSIDEAIHIATDALIPYLNIIREHNISNSDYRAFITEQAHFHFNTRKNTRNAQSQRKRRAKLKSSASANAEELAFREELKLIEDSFNPNADTNNPQVENTKPEASESDSARGKYESERDKRLNQPYKPIGGLAPKESK